LPQPNILTASADSGAQRFTAQAGTPGRSPKTHRAAFSPRPRIERDLTEGVNGALFKFRWFVDHWASY
jgi:hypothetical protein